MMDRQFSQTRAARTEPKRQRMAVAVQLALTVCAGPLLLYAPQLRAQQITCPVGSLTITTTQSNATPCDINNTLNINSGGTLNNNSGGTLTNSIGTLNINSGGILNNNSGGTLNNIFTLDILSGGILNNNSGGTLNISGAIFISGGGTLTNNSGGTLTNIDGAALFINSGGILNNNSGGTLNNSGGAVLVNNGTLNNSGTITNSGAITNNAAFNNLATGIITNNAGGQLNFSGAALGGMLTNSGMITNNAGGTLTLNNATNTGTINNSGTFNGTSVGTIDNNSGGTINNNSGGTLNNIGTLNINSGGTLNNNAGATLNNNGTLLRVFAGGTLNNSGTLNSTGSFSIAGAGTINNSGTFNSSGQFVNSNGTFNNSGTLNISGNSFTLGSVATINNSGTLIYSANGGIDSQGTFNNSGTFIVSAGGVLLPFVVGTGPRTITQSAGTLQVDGLVDQDLITINGGLLTGTGTIIAPVTNSGTLRGGAAGVPGTLTIIGNLTQTAGAVLAVSVTPAQASRITVTGAANVAGSVQVSAAPGTYPTTPYTIMSAGGGVNGTFSGVSVNSVFLSPLLSYDANNVYLSFTTQTSGLSNLATTPNQRAVSGLLETALFSGSGNAELQTLINTLAALPPAQIRAVLDSLAGASQHGAGFNAQFGMAGGFIRMLLTRIGGGVNPAAGKAMLQNVHLAAGNPTSDASPVYAQLGTPRTSGTANHHGAWVQAYGNNGSTNGDANAAGYRQDGLGLALGADTVLNDNWRAGVAINLGTQRVRLDADGVAVAAYARYSNGPLSVDLAAGAGRNDNDSARAVNAGGPLQVASAGYHSNQRFAHLEAAYSIPMSSYRLEPVAALGYTQVDNPTYTETGAGAANLTVSAQTRESVKSYLGVRTVHKLDSGGQGLQLTTRLMWTHEFGNADTALSSAKFTGAPAVFQTRGIDMKRDGVLLGLGLSGELRRNLALFGDVVVEARQKQSSATVQAGVRYSW